MNFKMDFMDSKNGILLLQTELINAKTLKNNLEFIGLKTQILRQNHQYDFSNLINSNLILLVGNITTKVKNKLVSFLNLLMHQKKGY